MAELGTANEARAIRVGRKTALFDFVAALGFDPKNVRDLRVDTQVITVTQFVRNPDNTVAKTEGGDTILTVHTLRTDTRDIDKQEELNDFLDGKPVKPVTDAFGQVK